MDQQYLTFVLIGICLVFFLIQVSVPGFTEALLLNEESFVQPWRFVSSIFLHGDIAHFFYNMLALLIFGSTLEHVLGSKRFMGIFLVTGVLANLVSVFFYDSSLGASGAIFGLIGALVLLRPRMMVWAFGLPLPLWLAGIVWAGLDVLGVFMPSQVANLAHLSGMAFGLVLGGYYRYQYREHQGTGSPILLREDEVRRWEERHL